MIIGRDGFYCLSLFIFGGIMRNERKFAYQNRRIADLEAYVKDLEAENKMLSLEIEHHKKIILSKDQEIEAISQSMISLKEIYDKGIHDNYELKLRLQQAIAKADSVFGEYSAKIEAFINRIKNER